MIGPVNSLRPGQTEQTVVKTRGPGAACSAVKTARGSAAASVTPGDGSGVGGPEAADAHPPSHATKRKSRARLTTSEA
jgi:hypothetical protein